MINISRLLDGRTGSGDAFRYHRDSFANKNGVMKGRGPVVVWNLTRACNLACRHCYSDSDADIPSGEIHGTEAEQFLDDLAQMRVPVLLFSGGEPMMRSDIFYLIKQAAERGISPALSTNGTLITQESAARLKECGAGYVGVSLDGSEQTNDRLRGHAGAYQKALKAIRSCAAAGQKVGIRFTISKDNFRDIPAIFELAERENVPRICFYHLVPAGRGQLMWQRDVSHTEKRDIMDLIIKKAMEFIDRNLDIEILTAANHADGVYTYLKARREIPGKAGATFELLKKNGGNRSGTAIGAIDWAGKVHPDQFTRQITLGDIRLRRFSAIWEDVSHPAMKGLKDRKELLRGRCGSCRWIQSCNGNLRGRALVETGNLWASDPGCYLTDEEIA